MLRKSFREAIPEIFNSAHLLSSAVENHLSWNFIEARKKFIEADNIDIKIWVESIIWKNSPYIQFWKIHWSPMVIPKEERVIIRMPSKKEKTKIHERDWYICRFCWIPVIRAEIRNKIIKAYPDEVPWWKTNISRHSAFFAMWAQYDHIIPHARWWDNTLDNLILTCTACNFWRMNYTLDEVWILYPELPLNVDTNWNGLEGFK